MNYRVKYTHRKRVAPNKSVPGIETAEQQFDTNGPIFAGYVQMARAKHPLVKVGLSGPLDEQIKEAYQLFYNECVNPNNELVRVVIEVEKIG